MQNITFPSMQRPAILGLLADWLRYSAGPWVLGILGRAAHMIGSRISGISIGLGARGPVAMPDDGTAHRGFLARWGEFGRREVDLSAHPWVRRFNEWRTPKVEVEIISRTPRTYKVPLATATKTLPVAARMLQHRMAGRHKVVYMGFDCYGEPFTPVTFTRFERKVVEHEGGTPPEIISTPQPDVMMTSEHLYGLVAKTTYRRVYGRGKKGFPKGAQMGFYVAVVGLLVLLLFVLVSELTKPPGY